MVTDREYLDIWDEIARLCETALAAGERRVTLEFSPLTWIAIIDEIKDRRARNYSRLLADDTLSRLDEAILDMGKVAFYLKSRQGGQQ